MLIKCKECGKKISDKSISCPNCGCPLSEMISRGTVRIKMPNNIVTGWVGLFSSRDAYVKVKNLYRGDSFKNLFKIIFPDKDNKEINNKTEEMLKYYTHEQEKEYGVIGIEIEIIDSNFRYTYNKLVRDKIPENIDNMKGRKSKYKILDDAEYLKELNRKVIEEANEFIEENSIEELGDLMEVLNAIMKLKGYKLEEVNKIMKEKNEKKGAFDNKIFLEYIDEEKRNLDEEEELQKKFRR